MILSIAIDNVITDKITLKYDNDLFLEGTKSSYMLYTVWQWEKGEDYADYIPISTAEDLKRISDNLSGKYYLVNDIDLYNIEWIPIASIYEYNASKYRVDDCSFTGVLDGNGYKSVIRHKKGALKLPFYMQENLVIWCVKLAVYLDLAVFNRRLPRFVGTKNIFIGWFY